MLVSPGFINGMAGPFGMPGFSGRLGFGMGGGLWNWLRPFGMTMEWDSVWVLAWDSVWVLAWDSEWALEWDSVWVLAWDSEWVLA